MSIKEPRYALFALSLLYHFCYPQSHSSLLFGKDATCSGIQIISLITRDKDLAKTVNLVNGEDIKDIYTLCVDYFRNKLLQFEEFAMNQDYDNMPFMLQPITKEDKQMSLNQYNMKMNYEYASTVLHLFITYPWLKDKLLVRDTFKKPVMTYGYGAGGLKRQIFFTNSINALAELHNVSFNKAYVTTLAIVLILFITIFFVIRFLV
jgi:hypothetical protein